MSWRVYLSSRACKQTCTCPTSWAGKCWICSEFLTLEANSKTASPQATLLQQGVGARFWPRPGQHKHPARQVCKSHQSSQNPKNRDHGIPGYSKVREKCGLSPILSLQERPAEINEVNQWVKTLPAWLCGLLSSVGELGQAEWGLSKSGRRRSLCGWPLRDSSGRYCTEH